MVGNGRVKMAGSRIGFRAGWKNHSSGAAKRSEQWLRVVKAPHRPVESCNRMARRGFGLSLTLGMRIVGGQMRQKGHVLCVIQAALAAEEQANSVAPPLVQQ
jgi:hypothetical protein